MHVVLGIATALVLAGATPATSSEAPAPAEATERVVDVVIAAPPEARARLDERVRELVGPLPARLRTSAVDVVDPAVVIDETSAGVFAKVWIDAMDLGTTRIYIVDAGADRILVRKVRLATGLDEVAIDEIGLIVESSVDALLQGGTIGVAREVAARELGVARPVVAVPPPARPPPPQPPPRARRIVTDLAGGWSVRAWGDRRVQHGPSIDVAALARTRMLDAGGALELAAVLPTRVRTRELELQLVGGSVRALAHLAGAIAPRWWWEGRIGTGVDIVRDRSRARLPGVDIGAATTRAIGLIAVRTGPSVELGRTRDRLLVRLHATLDVEVAGIRWVTTEGEPVFVPWRARPGVTLAIGWRRVTDR